MLQASTHVHSQFHGLFLAIQAQFERAMSGVYAMAAATAPHLTPSSFSSSTLLLPYLALCTDMAGALLTTVNPLFPLTSAFLLKITNNNMLSATPPSNDHRYSAS